MAGRNRPMDEYTIIADLMRQARRHGTALNVQLPVPKKDTFTVASTPAATYTLSYLPISPSINLSLNGLELVEDSDYTVDYTTAIVTVSATLKGTPTPADVLTADYWTTGDLIAASGPADTGGLADDFNRANNVTSLGVTSTGGVAWQALQGVWGINGNQAYVSTGDASGLGANVAVVECLNGDGAAQVTFAVIDPSAFGPSLVFRAADANNYWKWYLNGNVYSAESGVLTGHTLSTGFVAGDVAKVVMAGSSLTFYKNGVSVGTLSDTTSLIANTKHGMATESTVTTNRFDDFSFTP